MDKPLDKALNQIKKGMQLVWMLYLLAMVGSLPLYLDLRTGYKKIDLDKFNFFAAASFWGVGCLTLLLICFVLLQLGKWSKSYPSLSLPTIVGRVKRKTSVTDFFALLYGLSLVISYCFSHYQDEVRLGASGWFMGLFPQLMLVIIYFLTSRLLTPWIVQRMGYIIMLISSLVFGLAILNRYGIDPLGISSGDPAFLSTIGNINWLCGYWSAVFPLCCSLFWLLQKKEGEASLRYSIKWFFLSIVMVIGLTAVIIQGSESGILTIAALVLFMGWIAGRNRLQFIGFFEMLFLFCAALVLLRIVHIFLSEVYTLPTPLYQWLMEAPFLWIVVGIICICYFILPLKSWEEKSFLWIKKVWQSGVIFSLIMLVMYMAAVTANTLNPGCLGSLLDSPLFLFDENWGSARGGTWRAGVFSWLSQDPLHKLVGIGPDGMSFYIYGGENSSLLQTVISQFGPHTLTNAHNEWITLLADLGVLGLISFVGMIYSAMVRFLKTKNIWCIAFGLCLFSYTVNNIFSFQQIMNVSQMFILLGMGEAVIRQERQLM